MALKIDKQIKTNFFREFTFEIQTFTHHFATKKNIKEKFLTLYYTYVKKKHCPLLFIIEIV